ncbi:MAG: ABC transporter ATP-binding protein [Verrucomicrobia bacterium CG_4_10_14_3_um_filter_43_23]|nr:MAG: ABC transporter ATP-binding protein [Verrucomicrobia bacterium CG1_02_43_26]PIP59646.1 MAG: ABC transporter ATP-binding protein [Verrucomicrobia bacterium CG22_combo_CG10-13_8_21_14_all_43_17]PIX58945.1 MAG: ABC transporter ATP-binding protein [Verrucomicrobia bacterium CG_4_10_14_3_um_filter_43_23]PIY63090.1 MAG: ABC transporter ATP-binding protein [Verrucomicrobia bacterium CG_4_10_14_0_8_um_filter_43_34]PJA43597.1 MAG: ABC transporter ATP-binding protein [Verrucomicrobia bacterium CG
MKKDPSNYTILQANNIHRTLGSGENANHILRGVSISLDSSNVYSIVGPSGCGKSTLLYLLGLLDKPNSGNIFLNGQEMPLDQDELKTKARNENIGFVFQFHFLLPEFTALENVLFPMKKLGKLSHTEMLDHANDLLTEVGLGQKAHRLATQLSGGEQQRVAIARALANSPRLILADEPTGNLDAKNSNLAFDLLYRLAHERDQAILIVTHNPEIANACDHTLPMQDGQFVR